MRLDMNIMAVIFLTSYSIPFLWLNNIAFEPKFHWGAIGQHWIQQRHYNDVKRHGVSN